MENHIDAGTKVMVHIPEDDRKFHKAVVEYHGKEMVVARRVSRLRGQKVYYELVGAELNGKPLGFMREWLVRL